MKLNPAEHKQVKTPRKRKPIAKEQIMLKLAVDLTIKIHHEECGLSEERNALSKDEIKERVKEALETYLFDAGDVKKIEIDNLLIIKETEAGITTEQAESEDKE